MEVLIFDDMTQCTDAEVQRMLPLVSAQRREQAMRYKHTFGQFCCLKSWMMLSEGMRELGINELGNFVYNEYGKPYIEGGPYFSISHCKEGIAVAIDDQPIGIDIEGIRHADEELIERVMSEEERLRINDERLRINGERLADRMFTRLWTQKEAVVKAEGVGIQSFEQLQKILDNGQWTLDTFEKENYMYSIAQIAK